MEECKNYIHKYKCDSYRKNHDNCSNCEFKLPEEYLYDCETDDFIAYRNKYTGKEIHILKDENQNSLESKSVSRGKWVKVSRQLCECPDGYEPKNCKEERQKEFCDCDWASIYYKFICNKCGYEPKGSEQDFLPKFCANCGSRNEVEE